MPQAFAMNRNRLHDEGPARVLEIILLIWLWRKIGAIVRAKNRAPIGFQLMTIGLWLGGEIVGLITGILVLGGGGSGAQQGFNAGAYLFALGGAIAGAVVAFIIANSLSDQATRRAGAYGFPVVGPGAGQAAPIAPPPPDVMPPRPRR